MKDSIQLDSVVLTQKHTSDGVSVPYDQLRKTTKKQFCRAKVF